MDSGITLRLLEHRDLDIIFEWRNDPRIRHHMFATNPIDLIDHEAWFKRSSLDPRRYLLLVLRNNIAFGFAQLYLSNTATVADWGFYVDPGGPKGQGLDLSRAVLSYGFNKLHLHRITGQVLNNNTRSIKFHERIGFTNEGILRSHHLTEAGYQDVHLFGLLAEEWKSCLKDIGNING